MMDCKADCYLRTVHVFTPIHAQYFGAPLDEKSLCCLCDITIKAKCGETMTNLLHRRNLLPLLLLLALPAAASARRRRRGGHHRTTWGTDADDGHGGSMPRVTVASQPAPPARRRHPEPGAERCGGAGGKVVVVTVRVKGGRGDAVPADDAVEEKRFFLPTTRSS